MLKATRYEILRDVEANGRKSIVLPERPIRVATMMDEKAFLADQYIIHLKTVFLEDQMHDWMWMDGKFRYYTRVASRADVLIVYEEEEVTPPAKFDPMTGKPL